MIPSHDVAPFSLLPEKTVKTAYKQVFDLIISCVPFVDDCTFLLF